ncbi:MAG TPA: hypothetical protein VHM65_02485 [Candidatus Lustribacter sp.]|nr:hypothetical protein [Candidatus Lustribacter sp.]
MASRPAASPRRSAALAEVLASAARLQRAVPDAVLVGGAAAALYAGHRDSVDHDHVLADLQDRYLEVLEAMEATEGWVTSVRASAPPLTIMGSLGGVEAGLRQLRRSRPLEVQEVDLGEAGVMRAPTIEEILRVKSYLVVLRNQVRDYLDVVAVAETTGLDRAVSTLVGIDAYYVDRSGEEDSVLTALVQRLAEPNPRDHRVTRQLAAYKGLDPRWHRWSTVVAACQALADAIVRVVEARVP